MDNLSPQQIQQMIQLLQSMLPESNSEGAEDAIVGERTQKKSSGSIKPKLKKNNKKPARENKFDEMSEKFMHKEDIAIDRKLIVQPPVPRARKFKMIQTMCRVCGKKEKVNPMLITESGYKCNKCSGSPG